MEAKYTPRPPESSQDRPSNLSPISPSHHLCSAAPFTLEPSYLRAFVLTVPSAWMFFPQISAGLPPLPPLISVHQSGLPRSLNVKQRPISTPHPCPLHWCSQDPSPPTCYMYLLICLQSASVPMKAGPLSLACCSRLPSYAWPEWGSTGSCPMAE